MIGLNPRALGHGSGLLKARLGSTVSLHVLVTVIDIAHVAVVKVLTLQRLNLVRRRNTRSSIGVAVRGLHVTFWKRDAEIIGVRFTRACQLGKTISASWPSAESPATNTGTTRYPRQILPQNPEYQ